MRFSFPPRIALAHLPTPVHYLPRLSRTLGGPDVYLKRDDLTGFALSGNKVRKLEFVIADALRQGATVLITCGGLHSNHARATAVAAARVGLKCHLVLRGTPQAVYDGNTLIDKLVGAEMSFITPEQYYDHRDAIMAEKAAELEGRGERAYVIPEGASNALGAVGYLQAGQEIVRDEKKLGVRFDAVVFAVGSGGTYAGMFLASKIVGLRARVMGINVCDNAPYFVQRISGIVEEFRAQFRVPVKYAAEEIEIVDGYVGRGYGMSRPEELALIREVARTEGVLLDPVYTAKAMHGLVEQIRQGRFRAGEKVLFIHTGGAFDLFPVREELCRG
jgi:D-cysteine desulfhydrase